MSHQQQDSQNAQGLRTLLEQKDMLEEELKKEKQCQKEIEKEVKKVILHLELYVSTHVSGTNQAFYVCILVRY